jgi:hypothetical protein
MGFGDNSDELRKQAEQQERQYQQQLLEQRNAAILEGQNASDNVADVTVGNSTTYVDDPFATKKKKNASQYATNMLGL